MSGDHHPRTRDGIPLRLVVSDQIVDELAEKFDSGVHPKSTLSEFVERYLIPLRYQGNKKSATMVRLRDTVNWWKKLADDPPLCRTDDRDVARFVRLMKEQKGRRAEKFSPMTIRNHLVRLKMIFKEASRPLNHRGEVVRLMPQPPYVELERKVVREAEPYTFEEMCRILDACHRMTWPNIDGVTPPEWWRSLIEYLYYEGTRIAETIGLEYGMLDGELLTVPGEIAKHGHGGRIKLQPESVAALERIRTDRRYIFKLAVWGENVESLDKLKREGRKLLQSVGAYRHGCIFHGIRRANATLLTSKVGIHAAQMALRHTDVRTTAGYVTSVAKAVEDYRNKSYLPRLDIFRPVSVRREWQLQLPFPDAQRRLFV